MKNRIIYILILVVVIFVSCEDVVDVKLSEEEVEFYAVEAKITSESNPFVYLYKTRKVNDDSDQWCGSCGFGNGTTAKRS